jgi:hypothetical protein
MDKEIYNQKDIAIRGQRPLIGRVDLSSFAPYFDCYGYGYKQQSVHEHSI